MSTFNVLFRRAPRSARGLALKLAEGEVQRSRIRTRHHDARTGSRRQAKGSPVFDFQLTSFPSVHASSRPDLLNATAQQSGRRCRNGEEALRHDLLTGKVMIILATFFIVASSETPRSYSPLILAISDYRKPCHRGVSHVSIINGIPGSVLAHTPYVLLHR